MHGANPLREESLTALETELVLTSELLGQTYVFIKNEPNRILSVNPILLSPWWDHNSVWVKRDGESTQN